MTALLGLQLRLRMARLAVELDVSTADVAAAANTLYEAGTDLLLLAPGETSEGEFETVVARVRSQAPAQSLLGVFGLAAATRVRADVCHLRVADADDVAAARRRLPRWSLVGRTVADAESLDSTGSERADLGLAGADYLVVAETAPDLVAGAAQALPPTVPGSPPWFAEGTSENVPDLLATGAARLALRELVVDVEDTAATVAGVAERLHRLWQNDPALRAVAFRPYG